MASLIGWINQNAALISALASAATLVSGLASVATLIATILLAAYTYRYVTLTRDIAAANITLAKATVDQMNAVKRAEDERRERRALFLRNLAKQIRIPLKQFDPAQPIDPGMLSYRYLAETDIMALESSAYEVSRDAIPHASRAALALRVIRGHFERVRTLEPHSCPLSEQEQEDWRGALQTVREELPALEGVCEKVLTPGMAVL